MTGCQCVLFDFYGHPACGEPAVAQVTVGCVHEHVDQEWLCSHHLRMAKQNDLVCSDCKAGRSGHSCQVFALAEVNAAGERTVLVGAAFDLAVAS